MTKGTLFWIGGGALAAVVIYLLVKKKKLQASPAAVAAIQATPVQQIAPALVDAATIQPAPAPVKVVRQVASDLGTSPTTVQQGVQSIAPAVLVDQIGTSIGNAAVVAGVTEDRAQAIATAAQQAATQTIQNGGTNIEASISAATVMGTALGIEPDQVAPALVNEVIATIPVTAPPAPVIQPTPDPVVTTSPVRQQLVTTTTEEPAPVIGARRTTAIQGLKGPYYDFIT